MTGQAGREIRRKLKVSESVVQNHLRELAKTYRYAYNHQRVSDGTDPGWLDTFIAGPTGIIVAECKDDDGQPTDEQRTWMAIWEHYAAMSGANPLILVRLYRPADMRPSPDYGGKSRIQTDFDLIGRGDRVRWPDPIVTGIAAIYTAAQRAELAAAIRRQKGRTR